VLRRHGVMVKPATDGTYIPCICEHLPGFGLFWQVQKTQPTKKLGPFWRFAI